MTTITNFRFSLALIFSLLLTASLQATTVFTSTGTGNWGTGATWTQSGSGAAVKYIIQSTHTVTLASNVSGIDSVIVNGTLSFNSNRTLDMKAGGIVLVANGGSITGGSSNSLITWSSGTQGQIAGPWTGTSIVYGPSYANIGTGGFRVLVTPLPVVLIDFIAAKNKNNIEISWKTSSELNNAYFGLEKSSNGRDWSEIAQLKGNKESNTITVYNYIDMNAQAGVQTYRLKQVDLDGSITYSKIVSVNVLESSKQISDVIQSIYPNPSHGLVHLNLTEAAAQEGGMAILMNAYGQVVSTWDNINSTSFDIDLSNVNNGMYYLVLEIQGASYTSKISKY